MQNRDRHYARRFDDDSPKNKKKLPRRERIAKLTASRFSSAIIEKRAEHSERNRINEKKEAVAETEAKRQQRDAAFAQQSKRQGKRATGILYT